MKRFIVSFFLGLFYTTTSVVAADVSISRTIPTKNTNESVAQEREKDVVQSRATRRVNVANTVKNTGNSETKTNSQRTIINRSVSKNSDVVSRQQKAQTTVVSRSSNNQKSMRSTMEENINTVGRNPRVNAASINNTAAVKRVGIVLRASTAEVGGRATIGNSDVQTGSNIDEQVRTVHSRAGIFGNNKKTVVPTAESISEAKELLEKTADLNSTCQQQYNECMDQFCAVVDANQKRCSCSANLSRYAKAQKAVEDANTELNEVAQRIRYVGLSADEIRAIMTETEAEQAMSKTRDNTSNRSMLDDIADMIKDPTSGVTSFTNSNGESMLDLDLDFSGDSDLSSLDLFGGKSTDISNKRGKDLYNEATKRCKSVLNACKDAGGAEAQITGNYDLAIDKDCIAYEQGLDKLNKNLLNNVRSANLMLQKARLTVLQNKNEYDIKGCVAALETCMLDDMVCGEDYIKCLDPTKKYIDENGKVVLGRNIANITAFLEHPSDGSKGYDNSKINADFIKVSMEDTTCSNHDGACIVGYLMKKIGTGATRRDGGLCRAVLDKCQEITYNDTNKKSVYNPYNDVVINYIQRAMVNIKAAQSRVISDYASTCMSNISECYNQQVSQVNAWTTSATADSIYKVMTGACYNVALTCAYAVYAYDLPVGLKLADKNEHPAYQDPVYNERDKELLLIKEISNLFYQSLLCPDNSVFVDSLNGKKVSDNGTIAGYVNGRCQCVNGYTVYDGSCVAKCSDSQYRNNLGSCVECSGTATGGALSQVISLPEPDEEGNTTKTIFAIENNACVAE